MSSCMFLREGATLRDAVLAANSCFFCCPRDWQPSSPSTRAEGREGDLQAPLRRSRRFKCLHMQAGAIGGP